MRIDIASTWDGQALAAADVAHLVLASSARALVLDTDAPYGADPPPLAPRGPTQRLWEHEVVELFVLGLDDRYLEIELGPHGHHLVLQLEGRRNVVRSEIPIDFTARVEGSRWSGRAVVDLALLPPPPHRVNAYRIQGVGDRRGYFAHAPVPGLAPDFHRLETFVPLAW